MRTPRRPSSAAPEGPAEANAPTDLTTAAWRRALRAGLGALERGDLATATSRFETALAIAPDVPDVCAAVGHVRIRARRFEEGVALLVRAFHEAPDLISAACTAARTLQLELDRSAEAESLLIEADMQNPGWPSVAIVRAELAYHRHELEQAATLVAEAMERIEALDDDAPRSETAGARAAARELTARIANERGMRAAAAGELEQALFQLARAATASPQWATPLINRGVVFSRLGNDVHARAALLRALEIDPTSTNALHNLGLIEEREGNLQDARARYTRAFALLQEKTARHAAAPPAASEAEREQGPLAHAQIETGMRLAGVCVRLQDSERAILTLRAVLELDDHHRDATVLLASLLSESAEPRSPALHMRPSTEEHQHEH